MPSSFTRTTRSLRSDGPGTRSMGIILAVVILGAWGVWMRYARITVYATASDARIETTLNAHHVAAQQSGRIARLNVTLGQIVAAGEVLVELDSSVEKRRLDEALAHIDALAIRTASLRAQVDSERDVLTWQWRLDDSAIARAHVSRKQAEVALGFQARLGAITDSLHGEQLASAIDTLTVQKQSADSDVKAEGAALDVGHAVVTRRYDEKRQRARIAELAEKVAELEAATTEARAAVETARAELSQRTIRAPAAGKLGAVAGQQIGDVLKEGDAIATIVPADDVHVVAAFVPADAVGRVSPGQPARVRLSGFPWTQFGVVEATVTQVGSEPRDGAIRAELRLLHRDLVRVPLQHGLPGTVEVEVEQASPWTLLVRSAGLAATVSAPPPPAKGP